MATVFKFSADGSGYARGLNQMRSQTQQFAGKVKGLMAGLGAAFSIAGLRNLLQDMDKIQKLSLRFGIGAEQIQKLGFAAEQSGTSIEAIAKGLLQANRASIEAGSGLKTYQRAFDQLGVSYRDFAALNQEQQFMVLADAVAGAKDANMAMAAAQTIMGRAAAELMPLLKEGSEGYRALTADLTTYGDEAVAKAAEINDAINKMTTQIKSTLGGWLVEALNVFKMLAAGAGQAAIEIGDVWSGLGSSLGKFMRGDFSGAAKEWADTVENYMSGAISRVGQAMTDEVNDQVDAAQKIREGIKPGGGIAGPDTEMIEASEKEREAIKKINQDIADEQKKRYESMLELEQKVQEAIKDRVQLEEQYADIDPFSIWGAEKRLEIEKALTKEQELQKQAADQAARNAEKEKQEAEEIAQAAADARAAAADIRGDIAQEKRDREEIGMTEEQILARRQAKERAMVQDLANIRANLAQDGLTAEEADEALAPRELELEQLRTEIKGMQQGMQDAVPEADGAPQTSIISSALASIGGGGGAAMFTADPMLSETKKQTNLLESINRRLQPAGGGDRPLGEFPEL